MSNRFSRWATGLLVVTAIVLTAQQTWAIYYGLPPSKDEWKLKYDVEVLDDNTDTVTVVFTLADEGRLKPIYSIDLVAFSKQTDSQGGRSYDVKERFELKPTDDGKRAAQVKMRKEFLNRAKIRVLTQTVDGKRQPSGGAYIDLPLKKLSNGAPESASPDAASRPTPPTAPRIRK